MPLRRAVEQILANLESAEFNSLEIMRVATEASKRFQGVRYVTVSAQSRDIQESAFPFRAKDRTTHEARKGRRIASGGMIALIKVETILNL
jgi:predicted nucleotidyltransferase